MDFQELLRQFSLGNAAILTNVCLLPLYPGLIAFLAGNANHERSRQAARWLGLVVLAGVLTMMILIGCVLYLLNSTFGDALRFILPVVYATVIILGLLMLSGRNPFARLTMIQAPVLSNPYATAYLYGLLLGPMTLPCTGPIITTAIILGAGSAGGFAREMIYVLAFGLGFGWPLMILPFFAVAAQRRFTQFLSRRHLLLTRFSGILLVAIGVYGIGTDLLPNLV